MSDDSQEKTEEATPQKLEKSMEEGQHPERKNIIFTISLILSMTLSFTMIPFFAVEIQRYFNTIFSGNFKPISHYRPDIDRLLFDGLIIKSLIINFCVSAVLLLLSLFAIKFIVSFKPLTPNFTKFNPVGNAKNLFSLKSLYALIEKFTFFILCISLIILFFIYNISNSVYSYFCGSSCIITLFKDIYLWFTAIVVIYFIIFSSLDFKINTKLFLRSQKMSKDEIKREHKQSEGDPHVKSQRRQIAHDIVNEMDFSDITHAVSSASCIIGFHYSPENPTPFIITNAKNEKTAAARQRLIHNKIMIINLPSIANSLGKKYAQGSYIKKEDFDLVIEILRKVNEHKGN